MHPLVRATNQVSGRLSGRQRFLPSVLFLPPIVPLVSRHGRAVCFYGALDALDRRARGRATSRELYREERCIQSPHFTFQRDVSIRGDRRQRFSISFARQSLLFYTNLTFVAPYLIIICCYERSETFSGVEISSNIISFKQQL